VKKEVAMTRGPGGSSSRDQNSVVDLQALLARVPEQGPLWTHVGDDLNVNLIAWPAGAGVAECLLTVTRRAGPGLPERAAATTTPWRGGSGDGVP
jgi:hypothetical protein